MSQSVSVCLIDIDAIIQAKINVKQWFCSKVVALLIRAIFTKKVYYNLGFNSFEGGSLISLF